MNDFEHLRPLFTMLNEQLATLRKARGMTQADVAEALELPQGLISNFEKGVRRLHSDQIVQFAELFHVSIDELFGRKTKKNAESSELGLHLIRRMQQIEKLPKSRQKAVLVSIDMMLCGADTKRTSNAKNSKAY